MKKSIYTFILIAGSFSMSSRAADLLVDINGGGGAYTSIQTAIDAANAGDRIMIVPNGVPFAENLSINKSISLLCQTEGARFNMQGTITINSNATLPSGSSITISGMNQQSGDITYVYQPAGTRCKVNLLNSKIGNGNVNLGVSNFDLNMHQDSIMNGQIRMTFGKVIGCYLKMSLLYNDAGIKIQPDVQNTEDYIYVVGNYIETPSTYHPSYYFSAIECNTTSQYVHIANNHIRMPNYNAYSFYCNYTKSSGPGQSHFINNTLENVIPFTNYWSVYLVYMYTPMVLQNNLFLNGSLGIYSYTNQLGVIVSYNHFTPSFTSPFQNILDNGTNVTNSASAANANGQAISGPAIDGGNPDFAHWDLDNTPNDAGCYGGSWSRENFLNASVNSRTSIVFAPRRVVSGNTIDINAIGYDK